LEAVLEVIEHCEAEFDIKVRLLVSINRQAGVKAAQDTLVLLQRVPSPYICGIELSGDPRTGSFNDYFELLQTAR
jgi:adenosine deaminase